MNITICTDSLEPSNFEERDVFSANKKTVSELKKIAKENAITMQLPISLNNSFRYQNIELKWLTENLFSYHPQKFQDNVHHIHLCLANNRYSEIDHVASQMVELIREKGYQYHDMSVITKEITEYASLIRSIFSKYHIPVFVDEKKDFHQNFPPLSLLDKSVKYLHDCPNWPHCKAISLQTVKWLKKFNDMLLC